MQPLISPIDHESRHNSYRAESPARPSEQTPLLARFPPPPPAPRNPSAAVVAALLIVLLAGIVIGVYLLIVQSNSENILPPVETPLRLVSEAQWSGSKRPLLAASFRARRVLVVQTDTEPCHSTRACEQLLKDLQNNSTEQILPYNFLVSSNGLTFEALGWRRPSHMFPDQPSSLVLAFIGNFTQSPPTRAQIDEARDFFAESVSLRRLAPVYSIVGKNTRVTPKYLFKALSKLPQWDREMSDTY